MTSRLDEPNEGSLTSVHEGEGAASLDLISWGKQTARTSQLLCEGALTLLLSTSVREVWDGLVRAGLEWEDEFTRVPEHRARSSAKRG
jgi:hypothetical protein